jgi:hypothetical protein
MALVLVRLGCALSLGDWSVEMAVVSAKGPEYTEGNKDAGGSLSGHGTVISRVRGADGAWIYSPVEGTTYMITDFPLPPGFAETFSVALEDGTRQVLPRTDFLSVLGQNMDLLAGMGPHRSILAHLNSDYPTLAASPFYVSVFFSGLSLGADTVGCIPLDSAPHPLFAAGSKPVFGAPVMGLSHLTSVALPVTPALLADTPEGGEELMRSLCAQMDEIYPPPMDNSRTLSSFWQPCASPMDVICPASMDSTGLPRGHTECCSAFDDPAHTAAAVRVYTALAAAFNALQSADPAGDGITATAFGQYLSATLRFSVPFPRIGQPFNLTAVRNMRAAVAQLGITELTSCPAKLRSIQKRAEIPSTHHIYMCARGGGPVHAHRLRLA